MDQARQLDVSISALMRVLTIDERRLSSSLGSSPFNALDLETLSYIHRHAGAVAKDVAVYLSVSATTMQSVVDRLHKRGLLQRNTAVLKGRAIALTLTREGGEFRQQLHARNLKNCQDMLMCIDENERERFIDNMRKIAAQLSL